MNIGISVTSSYSVTDSRQGAQYMVERARAAHQAGLDSLFVGDHHVTSRPYYQNTAMLGRLLAEWGSRPAGALYLLPLWHPVLLAEQVATLACIASGPFILQCALGGDRGQSVGMGVDLADRVPMFEAALDLMQRLWAGETVSESRFWHIENARISPLPPGQIDVWVGSFVPKAIHRTARVGDAWLASPGLDLPDATDDLNRYRQALAEFAKTPKAVAIRRDVYVGSSSEEARRVVQPYIDKGYRGFAEEALMVGSVEEVAEQMAAFAQLGFTDIIVRNICAEQRLALQCIQRLGLVKEKVRSLLN